MTSLKRCVVVANNRSGCRNTVQTHTAAVLSYLNRAGIVHQDVHIPNDDVADRLRRLLPQAEALVLCGGDGTVNSTVNLLAAMGSPVLEALPVLLVPTGVHNSIATSLGVSSAERAASSLVVGRTVRLPLWAVRLHQPGATGEVLRYMCSYVATGAYAAAVQRQHAWKAAQDDYVSVPAFLGTFTATALYTTVAHAPPHGTAVLTHSSSCTAGAGATDAGGAASCVGPLRLFVAAQLPQQQPAFSLTPSANFHRGCLSVTTATAAATRLRLWHLLHREAREGEVLQEDGVASHDDVRAVRLEFPGAAADAEGDASLLVVDGECVQVPGGSTVTVAPTELTARFIVS